MPSPLTSPREISPLLGSTMGRIQAIHYYEQSIGNIDLTIAVHIP